MAIVSSEASKLFRQEMGEELGQLFEFLWADYVALHQIWNEYLELFGVDEKRLEIMNRAAPGFFRIVQDALWSNILLHLCRISDDAKTMGKDNAVLRRVPLVAPNIESELAPLLKEVENKTEFARDWRNRLLAHTDLGLALGKSEKLLSPASREAVRLALEAIDTAMHKIELTFSGVTTSYGGIDCSGGAKSLLYVLRNGLLAEARRMERLKTGKFLAEDQLPREVI